MNRQMEKKYVHPQEPVDLKQLPPIDPATATAAAAATGTTTTAAKVKKEKPVPDNTYGPKNAKPRPGDGEKPMAFEYEENTKEDFLADKTLPVADNIDTEEVKYVDQPNKVKSRSKEEKDNTFHNLDSGEPKSISAKSLLHEICASKHWKLPIFECCREEGPCHLKLFTYKVIIEIGKEPDSIVECIGGPMPSKKSAAEHAAEGALWYMKHLGYFPVKKAKIIKNLY